MTPPTLRAAVRFPAQPRLYPRSCQPRIVSRRSSAHRQLPSAPSERGTVAGQPSSIASPYRTAAPWLNTTTVPSGTWSAASRSAALARLATSSSSSTPQPSTSLPACQRPYSSGYRSAISSPCSTSHRPKLRSRSRGSDHTGRPVSSASGAAVSAARRRSLETIASGLSAASRGATAAACPRPTSSSGTSSCPWMVREALYPVRPCRTTSSRVMRRAGNGGAPRQRARSRVALGRYQVAVDERDRRAVLPQPVLRVELALLAVLNVHHDVDVVEQHPAAGPFALPAHRLGLLREPEQPLLDRIHDRLHLALIGCGGDQERVGDHELVCHVEDHDVVGLLVGGRLRGGQRELDGALGCGHSDSFRCRVAVIQRLTRPPAASHRI